MLHVPYQSLALAAALILLGWAGTARAQLAPWQQPPCVADSPDGPAAPNRWTCEEDEQITNIWGFEPGFFGGLAFDAVHDRFWFRSEFLGLWTKGFAVPPLLTTSPVGTPITQAGVLGNNTTTVIAGGRDESGGFRPGERLVFGTWLGCGQTLGLEGSYLQINRQGDRYSTTPGEPPIAARPFFDTQTNAQDAIIVNYPGVQSGSFTSSADSEFQVAAFLLRRNVARRDGWTIDMTAGYRYQQLDDHLSMSDTLSFSGSAAAFPAGSVLTQGDRFDTLNVFNGGEFGFTAAMATPQWSFESALKIGVGETFSRVTIEGTTSTTLPGQATSIVPGGLLALASNSGTFDSQRFTMAPELNMTFGWNFTSWLRGTLGYELFYWPGVARPGDQIDTNIDPRQFPPAAGTSTRPEFTLHTSDYWAQGFTAGLDVRF